MIKQWLEIYSSKTYSTNTLNTCSQMYFPKKFSGNVLRPMKYTFFLSITLLLIAQSKAFNTKFRSARINIDSDSE